MNPPRGPYPPQLNGYSKYYGNQQGAATNPYSQPVPAQNGGQLPPQSVQMTPLPAHGQPASYPAPAGYMSGYPAAAGYPGPVAVPGKGDINVTISEDCGTPLSKRILPWERSWAANICWPMVIIMILWAVISIIYIYVRITKSLGLGSWQPYGIFVLVIEVLGMSTLFLYSVTHIYRNRRYTAPPVTAPFIIRVCIPCYKEDTATLKGTLECAAKAAIAAKECGMVLPDGVFIYLCDDGPPTFKEKNVVVGELRQALVDTLGQKYGISMQRITRKKGEVEPNPKSSNLNMCMAGIYGTAAPGPRDVVAVFDADQAADFDFFKKMLPWMDAAAHVALVQSPQVFRGVHVSDDLLNHKNDGFWHYLQPAYNSMGFISCAGTNFILRASAFHEAGYFPTHTLTEDYALGMELKRKGYKEVYVEEQLVTGSAPDKLRAAFGQRSRWCKGPFQMVFSRKSPWLGFGLSLWMRILYASPTYIYIVSATATPTFMVVPLIFIWFGQFPAVLSSNVVIWLILYAVLSSFLKYYVRPGRPILNDLRSHWNAEVSVKNFFFLYWKAALRASMAAFGCLTLGWRPGAGGGSRNGCCGKLNETRRDLLPSIIFVILLGVSILYGILQISAGVIFVGPMGISLVWAVYHIIPPALLICYTVIPFQHEPQSWKTWYKGGRALFWVICNICFIASQALGIAALVLAYKTKEADFTMSGPSLTHLGVKATFQHFRNS